jgi:hypothetical protein
MNVVFWISLGVLAACWVYTMIMWAQAIRKIGR